MTENTEAGRSQYLTFNVAEEEYGLSVLTVKEILEYGEVTRVPRAPAHIRGVMNLRGRVVPLIDLALRLGLPQSAPTARTCVVVVEVDIEGERVVTGLIADGVNQVVEFGDTDIEAPPAFGSRVDAAFLKGLGRVGKRFVMILDVGGLFRAEDALSLAPARVA